MFKLLSVFGILTVMASSEGQKFFEVIADRVEIIYEDKSIVEVNVKIKKMNKTRSVVGSIFYHVPFGNDIKVEILTLKKQGGEYRYLPYKFPPGPFCDALASDKYVYPDIAKKSDFPDDVMSNCPLPAGNYSLNGFTIDLKNAPVIMIQSGEYCGEVIYYKDDQKVAVYRAFGYVNNI